MAVVCPQQTNQMQAAGAQAGLSRQRVSSMTTSPDYV